MVVKCGWLYTLIYLDLGLFACFDYSVELLLVRAKEEEEIKTMEEMSLECACGIRETLVI